MKQRERRDVYRRLLRLADHLLKISSSCSQCKIGCKNEYYTKAWCCGECPFLGPNGCTTQALACKLHWCDREKGRQYNAPKSFDGRRRLLIAIAMHYKIYSFRANEELSLEYGDRTPWHVYGEFTGPYVNEARRKKLCERFGLPYSPQR